MTVVDEVAAKVDERIAALRDEEKRLAAARRILSVNAPSASQARPKRDLQRIDRIIREAASRTSPVGRYRPGERQSEVLGLVRSRPGISTREIASEVDGDRGNTYVVVRQLQQKKLIVGDHEGWRVAKRDLATERTLATLDAGLRT